MTGSDLNKKEKTMFDSILKDGELIDPSQGIHGIGSVAIQDGKIAAIGKEIPKAEAKKVFDMKGKIVTPGLIDLHCHPVAGFTFFGVPPDEVGLTNGVTLLCDGGSAGPSNFETLRKFVIEPAQTDMLCFLNMSRTGFVKFPEIVTKHDIDVDDSKRVVEANRSLIRGIKIRASQPLAEGLGIKGIENSKKLAIDLRLPLMVHLGEYRDRVANDRMDDFSRTAVSMLEKGDILLHYLTWAPGGMILKDGTVYDELEAARKRGVILDPSSGLNNFSFAMARHAISRDILPTVISSDMATMGWPVVQSLPVLMSKFLNMGLSVSQLIEMTTINPAKALGEEGKRGSLKPGMAADITVFELLEGDYLFGDGAGRGSLKGRILLEPRMVFKMGKSMPAYSNYHIGVFT
jgi:dihydroorotase